MSPENSLDWNTERYVRDAAFVPELGRAVLEWLHPKPGQRILDLGCGDGALTREIVDSGAKVVGIDASASQVESARAAGLDARLMDAAALTFEAEFDAVFSNAALHWMTDRAPVLAGIARALKPGGRLVAEMGGKGNVDRVLQAVLAVLAERGIDGRAASPWLFPDPDDQSAALARAGLQVARIKYFERPTDLDCAMTDWLEIFAPAFAALLPDAERRPFFAEVSARLEPALFDQARGIWWVDYVRLRFEAIKS